MQLLITRLFNKKTLNQKVAPFLIGILLLSLGITCMIKANLGVSPFDALLVGLHDNVGLTVGSWEIIIAFLMILLNSLLIKQKPAFAGLITSFVVGIGIDLWLLLFTIVPEPSSWIYQFFFFIIGLTLSGLGTAIYLEAQVYRIPIDHTMLILQGLLKKGVFFTRTLIYLCFLLLAVSIDGPIGVGTIVTVLLGGPILQMFMNIPHRSTHQL
ncbi:YitT family protein [Paenibacillus sp. NPDC057886]|uniref:YczE/YyaS/YitT family protein n=1 Tax=Paenibacillus sp. NPDC057886 TaxID=3346270 RepID=UPI0036BD8E3C